MSFLRAETATLQELSERFDVFLLDAFGVFWESNQTGAIPGAKEAMERLVSEGKVVGILSNSTQLAEKEKEKYGKHGILEKVHYHFLLTSGEVAREMLASGNAPFPVERKTYWLFSSTHPRYSHRQLFDAAGYRETDLIEEADFIYIPTPHLNGEDQVDSSVFEPAIHSLPKHVPVFCANPDPVAVEGSPPRVVVRQGTIAKMFGNRGFSVYATGKPFQPIFQAALAKCPDGIKKEKILMIGDTPETDIRGAHGVGIQAALVTQTGILSQTIEKNGVESVMDGLLIEDQPDLLLDRLVFQSPVF